MVKRLFVVLLILVVWMGCWMDADLNGLNEAAFSGDIEKVKSFIVYCPIPRPHLRMLKYCIFGILRHSRGGLVICFALLLRVVDLKCFAYSGRTMYCV